MNALQTLEAILKGSLQNEVQLTDILIALHNVCAHGEIIGDGGPIDEDVLTQLFDGFEKSIAAAKEIEGR